MPRPKFCVGEEVATAFHYCSNVDRAEISRIEYVKNKHFSAKSNGRLLVYSGYVYDLYGVKNRSREFQLRKIPPEDRTSWEDCAWKPSDIREPVMVYSETIRQLNTNPYQLQSGSIVFNHITP